MNREIESDAMLPEYDFSEGMRGKHYQEYHRRTTAAPQKGTPASVGGSVGAEQAPTIIKEHRNAVSAARQPETALRSGNELIDPPPANAQQSE